MKQFFRFSALILVVSPLAVFAAGPTFGSLIFSLRTKIFLPLVGVLLTLALVMFFWGMIKYIKSLGSEKDKRDGKDLMIWGIIALAVMVSVWGLVNIVISTIGLDNETVPKAIILPGTSVQNELNNPDNY